MYLKQQLLHMLNRKMLLCKLHIAPLAYIPTCKMQYTYLHSVRGYVLVLRTLPILKRNWSTTGDYTQLLTLTNG